jgi:Holliday junction DNA helicase RuvA
MISFLRGRSVGTGDDHVIVDVGGVGFCVFVPASTLGRLPAAGEPVALHTHLHVTEDNLQLFGFLTRDEHYLFTQLLSVSGVGPRVALSVLSAISPEEFRRAVIYEDTAALDGIPGIGPRTAQRLVIELRDRLSPRVSAGRGRKRRAAPTPARQDALGEAVEALAALGYSRVEAGQAVEEAASRLGVEAGAEALVREGLKVLGRGGEA